ncbi:uncharacterized protein LOC119097825 [Pollicipes pollicipes]|nr:uncharacterized protein LOC119097825 [Pollicipes pollicipes]
MSKAKPAPTERSQPAASAASSSSDPHRVLVRRPWQLAEVDERGQVSCRQPPDGPTTVEYFRLVRATAAPHSADNVQIGQRRPPTPCSLFCFSAEGEARPALPSVQCLVCRCLSHASCVGLDDDDRLFSFVCVDCYLGVQRGLGFDGVGDSVPADSDSDPDPGGASDGSMEELIPPPAELMPVVPKKRSWKDPE